MLKMIGDSDNFKIRVKVLSVLHDTQHSDTDSYNPWKEAPEKRRGTLRDIVNTLPTALTELTGASKIKKSK